MSSSPLRLRLFGPPVLTGATGAPVGGAAAEPHRLALLALLALHPKRTVSRADLTRYLWPTRNTEQARQLLNQALFAISKALGDDAIFPSAKEVRLGARVSVDALEFQSALEEGRPGDAMSLYSAPLLDGFELDDAPEFQGWAARQRARFATAARTQQPVAEVEDEVVQDLSLSQDLSHDLSVPEKPEPEPEVAPRPAAGKKRHKEAEPPAMDFVLAEPEVQAQVEQSPEGPELRTHQPPELGLMTNEVSAEPEPVARVAPPEPDKPASVTPPAPQEPVHVVPPEPPPLEEVQWIQPDEPLPPARETPAKIASLPPAGNSQDVVVPGDAPPPTVESAPEPKREKRPRRPLPRPPAKLVVTILVLVALGAVGYMARGWIGAARGGIAAARVRVDSALKAGDRARDRARSIAVLPIEYSGRNQEDAAFAVRIAEELGPMLTRSGLIVIPGAALTRGGPPYDLRTIADSLGVAHILQGEMQKEGAEVGFRFRLVNPVDGAAQWEETFRPKLADIPTLEEYVASTVAARILKEPRERN